jgi:hypothetical protein
VKLKLWTAVVAALVLAFGVSAAQAASVQNVVNVTHDDSGDNELDIAINPTNSQNMIASRAGTTTASATRAASAGPPTAARRGTPTGCAG